MTNTYEVPRLTRSLRAFSDLDKPRNKNYKENKSLGNGIQCKQKQLDDSPSLDELRQLIEEGSERSTIVMQHLNHLRSLAVDLTGGDQSKEVVDEATVFLLRLFHGERVVSQRHLSMLKQMFGSVSTSSAARVCQAAGEVGSRLPESAEEWLHAHRKEESVLPRPMWGGHLCYVPEVRRPPPVDTSFLADLTATANIVRAFSMRYEDLPDQPALVESKKLGPSRRNGFGRVWLEQEVAQFLEFENPLQLSADELSASIVEMLRSVRTNDELQTELFDLLGFNNFELIQRILENRGGVVASSAVAEEKKKLIGSEQRRPTVGPQVLVQSEQERLLLKQARREEKKMSKVVAREGEDGGFIEQQAKRQAAIKAAMNAPIFRERVVRTSQPRESYPNVYDSQREAQLTAGFISGVKMMLPSSVQRTDNRQCEEVTIPPSEVAVPNGVGDPRVNVSSLDPIGQAAFQGVDKLNRIQSVVFDVAYHTNENLLVCAPTGAGKTNVAMLTVVHQIRQFTEGSNIRRDEFKIVYVAPMKALAAEMTANFSRRLQPLGIAVRELTGDMQLTKAEILKTQMLVTTPEKWDVVTRKGSGDIALTSLVKLLIIDEVHLLHGDRGPVVEALVARTLRLVESSQSMIRIVGLSATLPNYLDVARFLRVNPQVGLFFFDGRFRPVPLRTTFIGVKATKPLVQMSEMDQVCYEKVVDMVQRGHQVMVFVHARNATARCAMVLREMAQQKGQLTYFQPADSAARAHAMRAVARNKQLSELFTDGFAIHHAGLLRSDRTLVERHFAEGTVKVLVCTSTLAWGVNLPAHAVIIRGTEIYDAKHGSFVDLGILDVLQIFGRAGRPQYDTSGVGIIITSYDKLSHYLSLLTNQFPIESNFIKFMTDNLNAEVVLGTISNVGEAVQWLSYTYLFVRMRLNPQVYGFNYQDVQDDPMLEDKRRQLIVIAARALDAAHMVRYNERTGDLSPTDLGRTASHYYIKYDTVQVFNELMADVMTEEEILSMMSQATEFSQLKVRDDEMVELDNLTHECCEVPVRGGSENLHGKVNILLQTFLSRGRVNSFSLVSDLSYVTQNAVRIARALFEVVLRRNNPLLAGRMLMVSKMLDRQQWDFESPMRQFSVLSPEVLQKLDDRKLTVDRLREMDVKEIGLIVRHTRMGAVIKRCAEEFPCLELNASLQPITRSVLRIRVHITANFKWNDRVHGKTSENFWIWIEDPETNFMYHSEYFLLTKKQVVTGSEQELVMTIPLTEPLPPQYYVRAISDRWLGSETSLPLTFQHLILPEIHPPHTDLLELQPLPVSALQDPKLESLYKFSHFNPVQTQIFHCLYHTDYNVLLGAPTGSGKTVAAELAMYRVFREQPGAKVVYIAPLKALVRERMSDWGRRLGKLGRHIVELTGDVTPDMRAVAAADLIVTTPEKWDGVSRSWQTRSYVRQVALVVIDEIHLLGEDRGPVLEVIVSRLSCIAAHTSRTLRVVGLSTALANAGDLAEWLGIKKMGMYNFRPSVRPVPLEVHIAGFPGKHYCPRMASMNRPAFQAIRQHSPDRPTLVFVSSRRQTRLTALGLVALQAAEGDPRQWLHIPEHETEQLLSRIKDPSLRLALAWGVGLHHAGLGDRDRRTVEELFWNQKIQVLVATATLAWGVNLPAHLVVVKGTEYYDARSRRYVDMPLTDVLQMVGRAGRPQFDDHGVAVLLAHDAKKSFYKRFLYEPFPVESCLPAALPDHINAEVVAGSVRTKQDVLDYLTWTYFFRRLLKNPTYYGLESLEPHHVNTFLSQLVEKVLGNLLDGYCLLIGEDERELISTSMGRIASFYYLSHRTMRLFRERLTFNISNSDLLRVLSDADEYEELPVRHNEDLLNAELSKSCPLSVDPLTLDSPHTKTFLLLQTHFSRLPMPITDYQTDLKSVLDQGIRILQAMVDVCAERGWLASSLRVQQLMQQLVQARWAHDPPQLMLPHVQPHLLGSLRPLPQLLRCDYEQVARGLRSELDEQQIEALYNVLQQLPNLSVKLTLNTEGRVSHVNQPPSRGDWMPVIAGQDVTLSVTLRRLNRARELRAYCPHFPRGKDEGWFLTLGCVDSGELLALRRVAGLRSNSTLSLSFQAPQRPGRAILTLYIMSDSYLGLDQQYDIQLEVLSCAVQHEDLPKDPV